MKKRMGIVQRCGSVGGRWIGEEFCKLILQVETNQ